MWLPGGLVAVMVGLVLGAASPALAAEDLPQTTDELWERLPSYDVAHGRNSDTKYCRRMLKDLKNHPGKFERIPPKVETDRFEDPKLQELLPGCSRKELTFSEEKDPDSGLVLQTVYAGEGFALWPLSYIDESYPKDLTLVWQGPSYFFEEDGHDYLPPERRKGLNKIYGRYGDLDGRNPETCNPRPRYGTGTLAPFDKGDPNIRNMFLVRYQGNHFILDADIGSLEEKYVTLTPLDPKSGKLDLESQDCAFFSP
ncbi:MAG: hypothetical protein V5A19_14030 [Thiohalorhabdus sp.]